MDTALESIQGVSYKDVFAMLPGSYLVVVNDGKLTVAEVNNDVERIFHKPKDQIIGKPLEVLFGKKTAIPDGYPRASDVLAEALTTCFLHGTETHADLCQVPIRLDDGSKGRLLWECAVYPIVKDARVLGAVISACDVTGARDNNAFMDGRLEYLEKLVASNKSKDEFISIASHQLRTPATGVKQYIGMLREGFFGELSEDQASIVEKAYDSNERQLHIVNDLLKVAQVDDGKIVLNPVEVDLNVVVMEVLAELEGTFAKHEQIVSFTPLKGTAVVLADTDTLRMVLENTIDNASKYSPEGRAVDIIVTRKVGKTETMLVVEVADRGVGIPEEEVPRLFKKFSRLPNELSTTVGGTGLGLYWAKKIMLLHGGDIVYKSRPGGGSRFLIKLPV